MKMKSISLLFAGSLFFTSCDKKADPANNNNSPEAAAQAVKAAASPEVAAKRADKLGFVKYLPLDTDGIIAFYDGAGLVKATRDSGIGKFIEEIMEAEGVYLDDITNPEENPEAAMAAAAFAEEFFISFGNGTTGQLDHLLKVSNYINHTQIKMGVKLFAEALTGEGEGMDEQAIVGMLVQALDDPKLGAMDMIDDLVVPTITLGIKVSDADMRNNFAQQLAGGIGQMTVDEEAPVEELTLDKNGFQLKGAKIIGAEAVKMLNEDPRQREEMEEVIGKEKVGRIIDALAKKNICVASAVKDEYLVFTIGGSEDAIHFAESAGDSVAAHADFAFMDNYTDKTINILAYGEGVAMAAMEDSSKDSYTSYLTGLKDGLDETKAFGDTSNIKAATDKIIGLMKKRFDLYTYGAFGFVGFLEDGFKMESHSKTTIPGLDFDSAHQFSTLGEGNDVFLFANWVNNPETMALDLELMDALGELAYQIAKKTTELEIDTPELEEFAEGFGMFEEHFSKDLLEIWKAIRGDWAEGVGSELAFVIDLNGGLPTAPGIPESIVKEGKMPRITLAAPVEDRDRLKQCWTRINTAVTNLLKTASEMSGEDIPMQEPIQSTQDGKSTWFFTTIPFTTNDFMPNVTVSDDYFFASSSKNLATGMEDKVKAGGGPERKGAYINVNFNALEDYVNYWLKLVEKNSADLFADNPSAQDDFMNNLPTINEAMKAFSELENFSVHTRKDGDEYRSTLHFKTK